MNKQQLKDPLKKDAREGHEELEQRWLGVGALPGGAVDSPGLGFLAAPNSHRPGQAGHLRGDRRPPLLSPEPHRGALADRPVLLLLWPGGRHHQGQALLRGCRHRPAAVVVSDGALPAGGGVQSAPRHVRVELQPWTQGQNHQGHTIAAAWTVCLSHGQKDGVQLSAPVEIHLPGHTPRANVASLLPGAARRIGRHIPSHIPSMVWGLLGTQKMKIQLVPLWPVQSSWRVDERQFGAFR